VQALNASESSSIKGSGLHSHSSKGHGVVGVGNSSYYTPYGNVPNYSNLSYSYGGIFGATGTNGRALGVDGSAYATGSFSGGKALDIAEWAKVSDKSIGAGDVLVIDVSNSSTFKKSDGTYSTTVAGIVSTDPNYLAGNISEKGELLTREEIEKKGYRMLALVGQVPCNVSDENGPINIGDLLTTSSTPGYAMKVVDKVKAMGAIVGKALEPLNSGKGKIKVLLSLQ